MAKHSACALTVSNPLPIALFTIRLLSIWSRFQKREKKLGSGKQFAQCNFHFYGSPKTIQMVYSLSLNEVTLDAVESLASPSPSSKIVSKEVKFHYRYTH